MNQISSVLTIHYRDKWLWIYIPALILFLNFFVSLAGSFIIPTQTAMYTGGASSVLVYLFVAGIFTVHKTFPFAVGMSIRRTDFFLGTAAVGLIASLLVSLLILSLAQLEILTNGWGNRVHFFHFPYINDGTLVEQFSLYTILFLSFFFLAFFMSSLGKRFGVKGVLIFATVSLITASFAGYLVHTYNYWDNIFNWFIGKTAIQITYWLIPFVLIYIVVSFLLLRRASV